MAGSVTAPSSLSVCLADKHASRAEWWILRWHARLVWVGLSKSGRLPLDDAIGEERGTPLEGGCPRGQRLDLGRRQPRGGRGVSSQLCCGPSAAAAEARAGLHPDRVRGEGLQAVKGLLGGHAFGQLQEAKDEKRPRHRSQTAGKHDRLPYLPRTDSHAVPRLEDAPWAVCTIYPQGAARPPERQY